MSKQSARHLFTVFLALLCMLGGAAVAQSVRGSMAGNVTDPTGAQVSGAKITAKNVDTGVTENTVSTSDGSYRFPELSLGRYDVTTTAPGFQTSVQRGVLVTIASTSALSITLQAGGEATTISVDASAPTVETQTSDVGGTIDSRQIVQLPLALGGVGALRSPEAFEFLLPGTTGPGTANSNNGIFLSKLAGGQEYGNEVLLDGASQTRSENGSSFDEEAPSVEAIQEFKITTGIPEAEYGHTTGGIENFVTKSGTNQFHGTAYDIFRNDAMDANTWFNNGNRALSCVGPNNTLACQNTFRRPSDKQNDYGGNLGGPLSIPHLYNGHDKLFFFFNWEQFQQKLGATNTSSLPTLLERTGNFTDLYNPASPPAIAAGTTPPINPCDGTVVYPGEVFDPATQRTLPNGTQCRTAFAGNVIPAARFSTVAKNTLNYIPLPTTNSLYNNYFFQSTIPLKNTTYTVRLDFSASPRNKFFFSYDTRDNNRTSGGNPVLPYPEDPNTWNQDFETHLSRFGWDFIIKPTVLNHLNFGYNRTNSANFAIPISQGINYAAQLGINNAPTSTNFPQFTFDGRDQYRNLGNPGQDDDNVDNGWRVNDSVSIQKGRNSFKVGLDYRLQQYSPIDNPTAAVNFARTQTASDAGNGEYDGNSFASLLLGQTSGGNFALGIYSEKPRWTSYYYGLFAQDDLKVSNNLTLNLGVRWDVDAPRAEAHNATSNFSSTAIDPEYGIPGALVFGTKYSGNTRWANTYYKDIAPRVGFAYTPPGDGKTVFRGGGAIFYGPLQYSDFGGAMDAGYKIQPAFQSNDGFSPSFALDAGFPAYSQPPNLDPGVFNGQAVTGSYIAPQNGKPAAIYEWSLQMQRELAQDLILEVGYLGNKAQNLRSSIQNINNIPISAFALGDQLNNPVVGNTAGVAVPFNGFTTLWGANAPVQRALRPFPQYDYIDTGCCLQNVGMSTYNALLVSLARRFRGGLTLQASYTWSKNITDADSAIPTAGIGVSQVQNPFDLHQEKAISAQDIPNTFVIAPQYQLPFGKGKAFLQHGVAAYLAGGWEIGSVQRYQSGQPVSFCCATGIPGFENSIYFSRNSAQSLASPSYRAGHLNPFVASENSYFNALAFIDPNNSSVRAARGGSWALGDIPRVTGEVRTEHYLNEDFSLLKTTQIKEGVVFSLKGEFLNGFNRHSFAIPDLTPTDPTFGVPTATVNTPRNLQVTARLSF